MRRTVLRPLALAVVLAVPSGFAAGAEKKAAAHPAPTVKVIETDDAPKAVGPYAQAVVERGFVFVSGQIPVDPKTGELVTGGTEKSAERVFDNLEAILKAAGLTFADVVKTTVYLTRVDDFETMNVVYGKRMGDGKPARSTVIVTALPRNAPLEIDVIARTKR